jgi:hypothetical protein
MKRVITHEDAYELFDYLKGKTISLVGNAQSLLDREYGKDIDSSDVVMRINRGYPIHYTSQGIKTNVVWMNNRFVGDKVLPDYLKLNKFFYYVLQGGNSKNEIESCLIKGDLFNWKDVWEDHKPQMKKMPSQGFVIIYLLYKKIDCNLKIFGFDFQKTKTQIPRQDLFVNRIESPHDFESEEYFVNRMIKERGWNLYQ